MCGDIDGEDWRFMLMTLWLWMRRATEQSAILLLGKEPEVL